MKWKGVTYQENLGKEGEKIQDKSWGTTSFRGWMEKEKASLYDTLSKRDQLGVMRKTFYSLLHYLLKPFPQWSQLFPIP